MIFVLFTVTLVGCDSRRAVLDIWDYLCDRPDSALVVLNSLDTKAFHGRTLAEYRLLKMMALDKNDIRVSSDSLIRPAFDYFHSHGPKEKEMLSLYYLGMSQYYAKNYSNAIVSLECVSSLADSSYLERWAKLHLGDCYVGNSQFNKANAVYASLITQYHSDSTLLRQTLPHYAWSTFMAGEQNENALQLYLRAINDYRAELFCQDLHHYGVVLLAAGMEENVFPIMNQLEDCDDSLELVHDLRCRLFKMQGNYRDAFEEYEALKQLQDKKISETLIYSFYRSQLEVKEQELENALLKLKVIRGYVFITCVSVIFLVAIMLIVIWRRKAVKEKEQLVSSIEEMTLSLAQYQEQNTSLEGELELARQKYVGAYKKQFQKIASLVEYYRTTSDRQDGRDLVYRQVMELSSTVGKDRMSMRALERNVNVALDNAMSLYREDFPGKSQEHYDLVCYFMAGFPASLIELLTGISKNTLYSKKSRLLDALAASHSAHKDLFYRAIK